MFEHILDCPQCGKRFHFNHEGNVLPEKIACPECGVISPCNDYFVIVLCNGCRSKLKIPAVMLNESGNLCPKCGEEIHPDVFEYFSDGGVTITGVAESAEKKQMLHEGDFFDKYRIIKLLGKGGMAEVYLAEHLLLKQLCALKLMQRSLDMEDNPVFIKRFVREAKLTHSLNHPNIVRVFDAGSDFKTGYLFLAMEYVVGKTLHDTVNEKILSESELLKILTAIANALKSLEAARIVHRDIKPSNIMLTGDGIYKLMDLGIAKMDGGHQAGDMTLTIEQATIGTPGYASPEQCNAAHKADIRSDIYSLGATLYHAASGVMPFSGDTPVAIILNMMQNEAVPLKKHRPDLSDHFVSLVEKMMKKKPEERFQHVDELLESVDKVVKGKSITTPRQKFGAAVTALATTIWNGSSKKNKFNPLVSLGKITAAVLLTAVAALHIWYVACSWNPESAENRIKYGDFLKSILSTFREKKTEEKSIAEIPPEIKWSKMHPLIADPEKDLRPETFFKNNTLQVTYPVATIEMPHKVPRSVQYDFNSVLPDFTGVEPDMLQNGVLICGDRTVSVKIQRHPYYFSQSWSACLNFRLNDNSASGLFKSGDLECFVYRGTLRIIFRSEYYTDTKIKIPEKHWLKLMFMLDVNEGRITVLSGNLLLGSWFFPRNRSSLRIYTPWVFRSDAINKTISGEIDFFAVTLPAPVIKHSPHLKRGVFCGSEQRLPDTIYSSADTSVEIEKVEKTATAPVTPVSPGSEVSAGIDNKKSEDLNNEIGDTLKYAVKLLFDKNKDQSYSVPTEPPQASVVSAAAPETGKKQTAAMPFLAKWQKNTISANYVSDLAGSLERIRRDHAKYSALVNRWQASITHLPASIPADQKSKLREIVNRASEIRSIWAKRINYLSQRNKRIRENRQRTYNNHTGQIFRNNLLNYLDNQHSASTRKLKSQLAAMLKDPKLDPNMTISGQKRRRHYSGSLLTVLCQQEWNNRLLLKTLLKRYPDPELFSGFSTSSQFIEYGLPGKSVQNCFNTVFRRPEISLQSLNTVMILFMDGAVITPEIFSRAVHSGCYEVVLFLIACGADPNAVDLSGETVLFKSYLRHDGDKIRSLLLAAGANPEFRTASGKQASDLKYIQDFLVSWEKKDLKAVSLAVKQKKINVNFILNNGRTLLTDACIRLDTELVKLLLKNGANPNLRDRKRTFPLWTICGSGRPNKNVDTQIEIVRQLLEAGADPKMSQFSGTNYCMLYHVLFNQNKNLFIPLLVSYTSDLSEHQWMKIITNMQYSAGITDSNKQLILTKCPGKILYENFVQLCNKNVKLNVEIMKKILDAGLKINAIYSAKVTINGKTKNTRRPYIYYLIKSNQPADVVETALAAKNYNTALNWRDENGKTLYQITSDREVREVLQRHMIKLKTRPRNNQYQQTRNSVIKR